MTDQEIAAIKQKIAEAEEAYHALQLGYQTRVHVDQNGERLEFTAANRSALYNYILTLKAKLPGQCEVVVAKPLGFFF